MAKTSPRLDELKRRKAQLDDLVAQGVLTGDAAREAREKLEREIVDAVTGEGASAAAPPPAGRPSRGLVAGIFAFVLVFGIAGYLWRGSFEGLNVGPGQPGPVATGGAGGVTEQQIESMVAQLAERLKEKPDDPDGWAMLGRSYAALGRANDAVAAYKKVVELRKDAQSLADLADGLAMANNRTLEGEPERLIAEAVKLDGRNVKALALAGTVAFNREDYAAASGYWQRAIDASEPGSEFAQQLQGALDEARKRAAGPAVAAAPAVPAAPGASKPAAAATNAVVAGRVTLSKALADRVAPGDTLFIFARAANGPRVPLAILRKQAGELPVEFQLDDSLAMSPAAKLSSATEVVIGARISKSGNAMAQPGDLQVLSAPVALGTRGVALEIADVVK